MGKLFTEPCGCHIRCFDCGKIHKSSQRIKELEEENDR
jgi:hypothetical protein